MSGAARSGDTASAVGVSFGCPACPHDVMGPIIEGALTVFINGRPAVRELDHGVHALTCCGDNTFQVVEGSSSVIIEGYAAARKNDETRHSGYKLGKIDEGSTDVIIGG